MSYNKPILYETAVEVEIDPNSISSFGILKIIPIYKEKGYPTLKMVNGMGPQPGQPSNQLNVQPMFRMWDEKKHNLIQLTSNIFVVNKLINIDNEYLGWSDYKKTFEDNFNILKSEFSNLIITGIRFVTLDKFEVPKDSYVASRYLNCDGSIIPEWYKDKTSAFDAILGLGDFKSEKYNDQIKVHVGSVGESIEIRFSLALRKVSDTVNLLTDLESLHDKSYDFFESLITDETRKEIMEGLDS